MTRKQKTEWELEEKRVSTILTTDPHGEHHLCRLDSDFGVNNSIFLLKDREGKSIGFTGEELTSLATQWLKFARLHSKKA